MGLIYKIACDITNKCYVGQTIRTLDKRLKDHNNKIKLGSKNAIHCAIRKYGWEHFNVEVLEDNIPLENLNERELYYTDKFNALAPNGYVLIAGGEPRIMSEETKQKISKEHKGKFKGKLNPFYNKKHSEETIKKIFGKNHWGAKKVLCYDLNNNFIKEYDCMMDASRELNIHKSCISRVCKNKQKRVNNYKFKYKINE